MIRVGRCIGTNYPSYPNYTSIIVMMKSHSKWGVIGPYLLKNDKDEIMENIWQFSKVYEKVPRSIQRYSRWDNTIIWDHPEETHFKDNELTPEYFNWREKGMKNKYPVRYHVGFNNRHTVLFAYHEGKRLDYISARKEIYCPEYCKLVKQHKEFNDLKRLLDIGINLLIIEVDGPHTKDEHGEFTIEINETTIKTALNDETHPFGHGYCLATALLGKEEWLS